MMLAAATQGGMGVAAMGFIAAAQEQYAEELVVVRPEHETLVICRSRVMLFFQTIGQNGRSGRREPLGAFFFDETSRMISF